MSPERRIKLTRHSLLTMVALDTLSFALNQRNQREALSWFVSSKSLFPSHPKYRLFNNRGSFLSDSIVSVLGFLSDINPVEKEDLVEVEDGLESHMESIGSGKMPPYYANYYLGHRNGEDTAIVLILAISAGYYGGLIDSSMQFVIQLYTAMTSAIGIDEQDLKTGMALCLLMFRLYHTGWFCHESMEELINFDLVDGILKEKILELMDNCLDGKYLSQKIGNDMVAHLTESESIFWQGLFYMTRVSTAYPREIVKSLPREQIPEIIINKTNSPNLVVGVFGALCTLSEPNFHPLVTKHLRESTIYVPVVDELLEYVS